MTHPLPEIHLGIVLAYPCPACNRFVRAEVADDGCFIAPCCRVHITQGRFGQALDPTTDLLTRPSLN